MDWQAVVDMIKRQRRQALDALPSDYKQGYLAALRDLLEVVEDEAWEEGEETT